MTWYTYALGLLNFFYKLTGMKQIFTNLTAHQVLKCPWLKDAFQCAASTQKKKPQTSQSKENVFLCRTQVSYCTRESAHTPAARPSVARADPPVMCSYL